MYAVLRNFASDLRFLWWQRKAHALLQSIPQDELERCSEEEFDQLRDRFSMLIELLELYSSVRSRALFGSQIDRAVRRIIQDANAIKQGYAPALFPPDEHQSDQLAATRLCAIMKMGAGS